MRKLQRLSPPQRFTHAASSAPTPARQSSFTRADTSLKAKSRNPNMLHHHVPKGNQSAAVASRAEASVLLSCTPIDALFYGNHGTSRQSLSLHLLSVAAHLASPSRSGCLTRVLLSFSSERKLFHINRKACIAISYVDPVGADVQ
jgi:hypothetical protein